MHPILFEIGNWPVYSYGVLLALAYLVAPAAGGRARAAARASTARGHGPRDLPHHRGARRRQADAGRRRLRLLPRAAARTAVARARRRRVLRRPARGARRRRSGSCRRYKLPMWTTADLFAPGIALGHVIGRLGCLLAGCCYGTPTRRALGHHVHRIRSRPPNVGHAARHAAASDAALRRGRGAADPRSSCWSPSGAAGRSPAARSGSTCCSTRSRASSSRSTAAIQRGVICGISTSQFVSLLIVPLAHRHAAAAAERDARAAVTGERRTTRRRAASSPPADETPARGSISFSRASCRDLSRSQIQRLIRDGHVTRRRRGRAKPALVVCGRPRRRRRRARAGAGHAGAEALPLTILYDDADIVVVDKPAGHGRASGGRPRARHARQRAAPSRRRPQRRRRHGAAGHRPPARPRHVGRDGDREARPRASRARAAVPRSRGRQGIPRARLGHGRAGADDRSRRSAAIRDSGRRCRPARGARAHGR